jgi:hypothetical protein
MTIVMATFLSSVSLMVVMLAFKVREVESGNRNSVFAFLSYRLDPIVGTLIDWSSVCRGEFPGKVMRYVFAKIGILAARVLISVRNFSSKLAAHIYHTSKKAEAGDPEAQHPSFFIKAMLDFKDKMKEERKKTDNADN